MKKKQWFGVVALVAALGAQQAFAQALVDDANKILDAYDEHATVDFGGEGIERRMIHMARKKGQPWHLLVYAQRSQGKWQMTADREVVGNLKGLTFAGTTDESDEAPAMNCTSDGKRLPVFGWMKNGGQAYSAPNLDVVWTLDGADQPVPVPGRKVICKGG